MNDLNIPERAAFKPFTRVIGAPPGWPWDQARAARLEARHTSPVSGDDINIVVRRLKPWMLGEPGKFVAIYLRGVDQRQGLKFDIEVQGQRIAVELPSRQQKTQQSLHRAWILGLGAVTAVSFALMGTMTMQRRVAEAERLTVLETQVKRRAREAEGVARAKADAAALAALDLENRTISQALADLNTLSLKRDPAVRLEAYLWNKGYWAVEARGEAPPVADAGLQRAPKPVRKGVWLWVAGPGDRP
ncbi:hypothetical protein ABI_12950 [Asticcacaulis biprosthecium C19]|uniref:Uncharacterized protein n=1 Tax=Asticcacaulis biprosthecium C19 TaxID=715226 RepID=F4QHX0_9CAUL|nr:hypothetical protein [Asticcacaulis biprosthecium]EGF92857.1 hypothetical protein ABI_12950 [Asticcacaulis biprosthecium C19]